ncbi:hypothetical protein MRX96_018678 [Rhipicephalus microplus]
MGLRSRKEREPLASTSRRKLSGDTCKNAHSPATRTRRLSWAHRSTPIDERTVQLRSARGLRRWLAIARRLEPHSGSTVIMID